MPWRVLLVSLLVFPLASCGGGGGSGGDFRDESTGGLPGTGDAPGAGADPTGGSGGGSDAFAWSVLGASSGSRVVAAETRILRTQTEYDTFLADVQHPGWDANGAPPIDFAEYMAVAVFLGQRPTARWSVTITNIAPVGDGVHVDWVETDTRTPGCPPDLQVPSYPWVVAICTLRSGPATYSGSVQMRTCR